MIQQIQNNVGGFAGGITYMWIGQQFLFSAISVTPVSGGAANWSSNYDLLLDIIE